MCLRSDNFTENQRISEKNICKLKFILKNIGNFYLINSMNVNAGFPTLIRFCLLQIYIGNIAVLLPATLGKVMH